MLGVAVRIMSNPDVDADTAQALSFETSDTRFLLDELKFLTRQADGIYARMVDYQCEFERISCQISKVEERLFGADKPAIFEV